MEGTVTNILDWYSKKIEESAIKGDVEDLKNYSMLHKAWTERMSELQPVNVVGV